MKIYDFDPFKCCRPIDSKPMEKEQCYKRICFDCETYKNKTNIHIPYMVSMIDHDDEVKSFVEKLVLMISYHILQINMVEVILNQRQNLNYMLIIVLMMGHF